MYQLTYGQIMDFLNVNIEINQDLRSNYSDTLCGNISTDTRTLQAGDVFLAVHGVNFDGHDYVSQAVDLGAAGLILSKSTIVYAIPTLIVPDTTLALGKIAALQRSLFPNPVVAITGSCGKTTVKAMLASILRQVGTVFAAPGNFNNEIGVPKSLLQLQDTVDYAPQLLVN